MRGFLLALCLCAMATPTVADDSAFGHRLASCAGVLDVWGAVLKESGLDQGRAADDYLWKSIRLKKRARALIGRANCDRTFRESGSAVLDMLSRNQTAPVNQAVESCLRFYGKVVI